MPSRDWLRAARGLLVRCQLGVPARATRRRRGGGGRASEFILGALVEPATAAVAGGHAEHCRRGRAGRLSSPHPAALRWRRPAACRGPSTGFELRMPTAWPSPTASTTRSPTAASCASGSPATRPSSPSTISMPGGAAQAATSTPRPPCWSSSTIAAAGSLETVRELGNTACRTTSAAVPAHSRITVAHIPRGAPVGDATIYMGRIVAGWRGVKRVSYHIKGNIGGTNQFMRNTTSRAGMKSRLWPPRRGTKPPFQGIRLETSRTTSNELRLSSGILSSRKRNLRNIDRGSRRSRLGTHGGPSSRM